MNSLFSIINKHKQKIMNYSIVLHILIIFLIRIKKVTDIIMILLNSFDQLIIYLRSRIHKDLTVSICLVNLNKFLKDRIRKVCKQHDLDFLSLLFDYFV